jgi:hypothetical protein
MLIVIMLSVVMLNVVMLNVVIAKCCYAECCYAECRYAECHFTECRGARYMFCLLSTLAFKQFRSNNKLEKKNKNKNILYYKQNIYGTAHL